jgi:hypothetical protein
MQINLHIRCNADLENLFSTLFGDGPPETYPSKLSQGCRSMLRELDKIVFPRLFGPGAQLAKDEKLRALYDEVLRLGLTKLEPGEP